MPKEYTNRVLVIRKNEAADNDAILRVSTDMEKGTVTIGRHSWGSSKQDEEVVFPVQFAKDVAAALNNVLQFVSSQEPSQ